MLSESDRSILRALGGLSVLRGLAREKSGMGGDACLPSMNCLL